jgi:hypothetical protein
MFVCLLKIVPIYFNETEPTQLYQASSNATVPIPLPVNRAVPEHTEDPDIPTGLAFYPPTRPPPACRACRVHAPKVESARGE